MSPAVTSTPGCPAGRSWEPGSRSCSASPTRHRHRGLRRGAHHRHGAALGGPVRALVLGWSAGRGHRRGGVHDSVVFPGAGLHLHPVPVLHERVEGDDPADHPARRAPPRPRHHPAPPGLVCFAAERAWTLLAITYVAVAASVFLLLHRLHRPLTHHGPPRQGICPPDLVATPAAGRRRTTAEAMHQMARQPPLYTWRMSG